MSEKANRKPVAEVKKEVDLCGTSAYRHDDAKREIVSNNLWWALQTKRAIQESLKWLLCHLSDRGVIAKAKVSTAI